MRHGGVAAEMCLVGVVACAALHAQALVAGRVVDETGAGVAGALRAFADRFSSRAAKPNARSGQEAAPRETRN